MYKITQYFNGISELIDHDHQKIYLNDNFLMLFISSQSELSVHIQIMYLFTTHYVLSHIIKRVTF